MAVLDAIIAISEDLNLKFSRGRMPPDPASLVTLTRSQTRRPGRASFFFKATYIKKKRFRSFSPIHNIQSYVSIGWLTLASVQHLKGAVRAPRSFNYGATQPLCVSSRNAL